MAAQEVPGRTWNEINLSWMSARLGFAAMEDGAFYAQDAANKQQVGDLESEALFRLDDLSLSGEIKFRHPWTYQIAVNYKGLDPTDDRGWNVTNLNVAIPLGRVATVTVGKQKEGVGLEMVANSRDISFMELSVMTTAATFVDSHVAGVRFSNSGASGRMTWSAGWFNNWLDDGLSFDQSGSIFAGRVTGLPIDAGGGGGLLHVGVSGAYRQAQNGAFRSKSVPEVYEAPDFVDTGSFPANHSTTLGFELAAARGPFTISGEHTGTFVSSPETSNPRFDAYYVVASWVLTGESRPYIRSRGCFGKVEPKAPISFRHGGAGAWEIAARYSRVDRDGGTVEGGDFDRWSGALSWYPTRQFRLEFNYGYGRLDRSGLEGRTNFYQLRLQFEL